LLVQVNVVGVSVTDPVRSNVPEIVVAPRLSAKAQARASINEIFLNTDTSYRVAGTPTFL
jgi:hypothetical protein